MMVMQAVPDVFDIDEIKNKLEQNLWNVDKVSSEYKTRD